MVGCGVRKNLENRWAVCAVAKEPLLSTTGASYVWKVCEIGVYVDLVLTFGLMVLKYCF